MLKIHYVYLNDEQRRAAFEIEEDDLPLLVGIVK